MIDINFKLFKIKPHCINTSDLVFFSFILIKFINYRSEVADSAFDFRVSVPRSNPPAGHQLINSIKVWLNGKS